MDDLVFVHQTNYTLNMTQSDDLTRVPHDEDEIEETTNVNNGDPETDNSIDDEEMEVGSNQVDSEPDLLGEEIKKEKEYEEK